MAGARWQTLAEIALVFAVFFVQGAWPAPDVNEPNYLGKAIHFWNPAWAGRRFLPRHGRHALGLLFHLRLAVAVAGADGLGVDRPHADLGPAGLGVAAIELRRRAAAVAGAGHGRAVRRR